MSEILDCIVIGGGVVGLAIGRELGTSGLDIIVLEKNGQIGEETSSRNSEVIHAGIYYARGSLKARLCVHGKRLLYAYCKDKSVPHAACGKVIVGIDDSRLPRLRELRDNAVANGVDDIGWLDAKALHELEPEVRGVGALWSPSTGIVDVHALMLALRADLEATGGTIAVRSRVEDVFVESDGIRLVVDADSERSEVKARVVVNSCGLQASEVARRCHGVADFMVPGTRYAKGSYFVYQGRSPFEHLIYPLPAKGGLGIHATLDLSSRLRFGPDVEWCDGIDYEVDESRKGDFYAAIRTYWPAVDQDRLAPGYAGVRPKLGKPGEAPADFRIDAPLLGEAASLIHLFGIESPGLTASLAIAEHIRDMLDRA